MAVRAIRGATQVEVDEREHVLDLTRELVGAVLAANGLAPDDVISIMFTATVDIRSVAPALAARQLGLTEAALLCMQEMDVEGGMPRVVRLMASVETDRPRNQLRNVYLRGTDVLRPDTAAVDGPGQALPPSAASFVPAATSVQSTSTVPATSTQTFTSAVAASRSAPAPAPVAGGGR